MPQWVKIVLISFVVLVALVVAAGYMVTRQLASTFDSFEKSTTAAGDAGKDFGRTATLDGCVKEVVRRSGAADSPVALMATTPFAWGCLETAPYDRAFCDGLPAMENERALQAWTASTCGRHGAGSDNELCGMALMPVVGFCGSKR